MKKSLLISVLSLILLIVLGWDALAQMPNVYGLPINLDAAKKAAASATAEVQTPTCLAISAIAYSWDHPLL